MGCVSSRIIPDEDVKTPITKREKNPSIITGDINKKKEVKLEREKAMKLRQKDRITAAEEISLRTLEEKERLSLGTRSRGTSRVSSRAGSPTPVRKVHFKAEEKVDSKNQKNNNDPPSTNNVQYKQMIIMNGGLGANDASNDEIKKKKKKKKHEKKSDQEKNNSVQPITNNNTGEVTEDKDLNQSEILSTIDERASSRNSGKMEEVKR